MINNGLRIRKIEISFSVKLNETKYLCVIQEFEFASFIIYSDEASFAKISTKLRFESC